MGHYDKDKAAAKRAAFIAHWIRHDGDLLPMDTRYGYCECGCGQKTKLAPTNDAWKGWVKGEPLRVVKGHHRWRKANRFIEDPTTNCWTWQLHRTRKGYGMVRVTGRLQQAHRAFYEELIGPIPEGLTLDHLCRNRACVNPGHLEPVTNLENIRRGAGKKHDYEAFGRLWRRGLPASEIAEELGVSLQSVCSLAYKLRGQGHDIPYRKTPAGA